MCEGALAESPHRTGASAFHDARRIEGEGEHMGEAALQTATTEIIGRYALHAEIASGGMATVHFGRLVGPIGFSRPVAIKRLHPQLAKEQDFVAMFLDEARLAARIQHPNVVATLDVIASDDDVLIVMEYVRGDSLVRLLRPQEGV